MHPGYRLGHVYLHREPIDFRKQINGESYRLKDKRKAGTTHMHKAGIEQA